MDRGKLWLRVLLCWPHELSVALQPQLSCWPCLVNRSLRATVWCTEAGTSYWKPYGTQRPDNQGTDRIRYKSHTQLCTATAPKGEKLMLQVDAGTVSSRENRCQVFHYGTLKYFGDKKKRKINTNPLHASPALHQLSLGAEAAPQLSWPSPA